MEDFAKAHIKGYSKRDGTYVRPHQRAGEAHHDPHPHPHADDDGNEVTIHTPTQPSSPSTWHSPDAVATFVPGGDVPLSINGVPIRSWKDHPTTVEGWDYLSECLNEDLVEPPFYLPPGKKAAAGIVIEEPDGRVFVVHPTNGFGGYDVSWPKGTAEPELSLQGNSLKEIFEETGLKVQITGFIGDFERTTSKARFYRGKRLSGSPADMGWESEAVSLIPKDQLFEHLNNWPDHPIAEAVGAGPAPLKAGQK
jgi:8-oxo-dGTP pyrophosphatase MutT (NUDIX family)